MQRENSFHADAARDLAHGEGFVQAAVLACYYNPLKNLNALSYAFLDFHVNPKRIPGTKIGKIASEVFFFNKIQYIHF